MGLNADYLKFIESNIAATFGGNIRGLRMLELGDQVIAAPNVAQRTGKAYFSEKGFEHVSVDINGLHGAEPRDLRIPEQFSDWHGRFDVVTNSGTTEHVEPHERQFECFGILHDCLRVGGVAIHLIPDVSQSGPGGMWANHCRNYYSEAFVDGLARECGYELLANTTINGLRCAAFRKAPGSRYMTDRTRLLSEIAYIEYSTVRRLTAYPRAVLRVLGVGKLLTRLGLR